jgi:hypothetical protein
MIIEARTGLITAADGTVSPLRTDKTGGLLVADVHAKYMEAVLRGGVFIASNVGAQAVSVALATTYTGLMISNPLNSGKNMVLLAGQYALTVAPAAIASLHLIGGWSSTAVTHTTPLAAPGIQGALINGGGGSAMKADSAATIPTPGYIAGLGSGFTAAALYATTPGLIDFGGIFIVPPGGFLGWGALTAVTGFGTLIWEEVNVSP